MIDCTVGLFGTCGASTWRKSFINTFIEEEIKFYNPQLEEGEWTPDRANEFVQVENYNLKNNEIILFAVTDETTAQGSLAEIGFSVADTIRNISERYLIVYIDSECNALNASKNEIEDSLRSRKLVKSKCLLERKINKKVFIVNSLSEMMDLTLDICKYMKNESFKRTLKLFSY